MDNEKNNKPLYIQIYNDLLTKIRNNEYQYGDFLPAERELSKLYQVERHTLRRALTMLENEGYISKIQGAGNKVIAEKMTKVDKPNVIVYVIPNSTEQQPYHMEICSHLEKLCSQKDLNLVLTKSRIFDNKLPQWFYSSNIIGAIWVSDVDPFLLESAKNNDLTSVVFCSSCEYFPKVNLDDVGAGYMATEHLINCGCKKIAHIAGSKGFFNTQRRQQGYITALMSHSIPVNNDIIVTGDWNYDSGFEQTNYLLERYPDIDGIFASNDMMALGAINATIQKGKKIPDDIKIIGIDNIKQSRTSVIPLTTVSLSQSDSATMLFLSLNELFNRKKVPDEILIPAKLIIRKST